MFGLNYSRLAIWTASILIFSPWLAFATTLSDADALPHLDSAGQSGYRDFLSFDNHRAFAIAPGGSWAWKGGEPTAESASSKALQTCRHESALACVLYALDDQVVFDTQTWAQLWGPYMNRADAVSTHVGTKRGEQFHNLSFRNTDGKNVTISGLRGKVVVLHFWGSWCPPCRNEMPELQQLHHTMGPDSDIQMVLLQVQEEFNKSQQWAQLQHLSLPMYDSGAKNKLMNSLTLADGRKINDRDIAPAFPTTYILDKHGIVVFSNIGPISHWSEYLPLLQDVAARSGK
jgi:peroxiredoxin